MTVDALSTYVDDYATKYAELRDDPMIPLFNRAIDGLYAPGSCFKPVTALSALMENVSTPTSTFLCNHTFTYYRDYQPTCLGYHGNINVVTALQKSCNLYFYNAGLHNIDNMNKYANLVGLGNPTGIEINEKIGQMANSTVKESMSEIWNPGDEIQAAIGQSVSKFSPLQLANYTATLARNGKHLEAHLVNQVLDYNQEKIIKDYTITEVSNIPNSEEAFATIKEGMVAASLAGGTSWMTFGNYPITVASKTGTPETDEFPNSIYIAYAPAENPEIAVAIIIEKGWHGYTGAPVAKAIFDYYFFGIKDDSALPEINFNETEQDEEKDVE